MLKNSFSFSYKVLNKEVSCIGWHGDGFEENPQIYPIDITSRQVKLEKSYVVLLRHFYSNTKEFKAF